MQIIPVQPIPAQTFQIILDGQYCTISIYWRWGRCFMDLSVGETAIFKGALCLHAQAVNQFPSQSFAGTLYFIDMLSQEPPQWEGLGERWVLAYLSEGETWEDVAEESDA